jgi:hypothetical protein
MTVQILQTLISISLVSIFLTGFYTPLNPAREWITKKWISFFVSRKLYRTAEMIVVLSCGKCMSFIIALIYTQNFIYAIITSIFTLIINYIITYVTKDK